MKEKPIGAKFVRVLRGGQITLPIEFRRALDIEEGMMLVMHLDQDGALHMRPAPIPAASSVDSPWLKELYEFFEPVRREIAEKGYSEEEIYQWIDEAVAEVRAERRRGVSDDGIEHVTLADIDRRSA